MIEKRTLQMKSLRAFIKESRNLEKTGLDAADTYIQIPKKFMIDDRLTPKEKELWIVLAGFMYKVKSQVFPSRKRLAKLLHIKNDNRISKLTRRLQEKGCLEKSYDPNTNRAFYELYYRSNIDLVGFFEGITEEDKLLIPSEANRLNKPMGYPKKTPPPHQGDKDVVF